MTIIKKLKHRLARLIRNTSVNRLCGLLIFPRRVIVARGDIRTAARILILKPDEIGDVVLCTGFLRSLRRQCPQAHITLAIRPLCQDLVQGPQFADEIMSWPDTWRGFSIGIRATLTLIWAAYTKWIHNRPDWVLIPRGSGDHVNAALYAWWSGGFQICAHESFCKEWGPNRSGLVNRMIKTEEPMHELEFHRRMLSFLGLDASDTLPSLNIPAEALREAADFCNKAEIASDFLSLGVGAGFEDKRWPLEKYRSFLQLLSRHFPDLKIVIVGGTAERPLGDSLVKNAGQNVSNAAGTLSVLGTAALLRRSHVFVGNDSGTAHLAAASGCDVIVLFKHPKGGTDHSHYSPLRFQPIARHTEVIQPTALNPECVSECRRSDAHCITNIQVEDVLGATLSSLRARSEMQPS